MFKFVVFTVFLASTDAFIPRLDGRIVGGQNATIKDFPHQISLQIFGSHSCGGSIIGNRWVVTAAHCSDGIPASYMTVVAGISKLSENEGRQSIRVARIHQHPKFSMFNLDYDVSVLELAFPLQYSSTVQRIEMAANGSDPTFGTAVVVTGWGALCENGGGSDVLQKVSVHVIDRNMCKEIYGDSRITQRMICAGFDAGKDACQGDSGGPLVASNKLVGIVSWGIGCARPGKPGVYSRVGELRKFIHQQSGI